MYNFFKKILCSFLVVGILLAIPNEAFAHDSHQNNFDLINEFKHDSIQSHGLENYTTSLAAAAQHYTVTNKDWTTISRRSQGYGDRVDVIVSTPFHEHMNYDLDLRFINKDGHTVMKTSYKVLNTHSGPFTAKFWVSEAVTRIEGKLSTQDPTMKIFYPKASTDVSVEIVNKK